LEKTMPHKLLAATAIFAILAIGPAGAADTPSPASEPSMPTKMAKTHPHTCGKLISVARHTLHTSKGGPEAIASGWVHLNAAQQARNKRDNTACQAEATDAVNVLK
jgi:hypothetical protein